MTNNTQHRSTVRRLAGLGGAVELRTHRLVIRLPHPKLFQLFARFAVVAILLLSYSWIISAIHTVGSRLDAPDPAAFSFLADLNRLGLLTPISRSIFLGDPADILPLLISNRIEPVESDRKSKVADSAVDFLLLLDHRTADLDFADRVLKPGGVLAVFLKSDQQAADPFDLRPDYKIVHRSPTVIAARKTRSSSSNRKLLLAVPESKKAMILNELEDAVLEPPMKMKQRKKTKYLPDLFGGESLLAEYPRRVFVDVGPAGRAGSERWFERNYPKGKSEFEVIRIDEVEGKGEGEGLGDWMARNLKEEEYVVMKAEAEVVEEMVEGGVIRLVDELFMECRNQWTEGRKSSSRAYWECVALYGRLKDQGVAVHQWWDFSY